MFRDPVNDPVFGARVIRGPVTMKRRGLIDGSENAREVFLAISFARNAHVPVGHYRFQLVDDFLPHVLPSDISERIV